MTPVGRGRYWLLLLTDFFLLPSVIMPAIWLALSVGTSYAILGAQDLLGRGLDGSFFALPLAIVWFLVLSFVYAKLHNRIRRLIRAYTDSRYPTSGPESVPREILNVGLVLAKASALLVALVLLLLVQMLIWTQLLEVPPKMLGWDFEASEGSNILLLLAFVMTSVPWFRSAFAYNNIMSLPKKYRPLRPPHR